MVCRDYYHLDDGWIDSTVYCAGSGNAIVWRIQPLGLKVDWLGRVQKVYLPRNSVGKNLY